MSDAEPIATVRAEQGYDGLHQAFRARAEQLQITRNAIDELAHLTRGHAGKLLALYPVKAIGRTTLGPLLYALKLKIIVVADENVTWREPPDARNESQVRHAKPLSIAAGNLPEIRFLARKALKEEMKNRGRNGGRKSAAARTPEQRRRNAKRGWRKRRKDERERRKMLRCAPAAPPQKPVNAPPIASAKRKNPDEMGTK